MASYYLCPLAAFMQLFKDDGSGVLSGALIWTYQAGTSSPTTTWTDVTGSTANSNPIQLNSAGRLNNVNIWQQGGVPVKVVFSTNAGTVGAPVFGQQIGPSFDQISGIDDPAGLLATLGSVTSGSGADLIANAVRSYSSVSSVRAANVPQLSAGQTLIILVEGVSVPGDGQGNQFYWNASSTATDDGFTVIKPTALNVVQPGRYLLLTVGHGSFTGTLTGMSGTVSGTILYKLVQGSMVSLQTAGLALTGTSNGATMTLTGTPAQILPATAAATVPCVVEDSGNANLAGWATISPVGISFALGANPNFGGFAPSGTKGLPSGWTITYPLT